MSYYVHVDHLTYDNTASPIMTCTGVSEAIVLKIIDTITSSNVKIKIYREVDDELQNN